MDIIGIGRIDKWISFPIISRAPAKSPFWTLHTRDVGRFKNLEQGWEGRGSSNVVAYSALPLVEIGLTDLPTTILRGGGGGHCVLK